MKIGNLPRSRFTDHFLEMNDIPSNSFQWWHFQPGMAFQDTTFWWNNKLRKKPHEGIDLHCYTNDTGNLIKLNHTNMFPLLFSGRIVRTFDDFQGKTIHVVHDTYEDRNNRLHSLYGHTKLLKITNPGDCINENSAIISISTNFKSTVPIHLHLTVFWAPRYIKESIITWDHISLMKEINFIDPALILRPKNDISISNLKRKLTVF